MASPYTGNPSDDAFISSDAATTNYGSEQNIDVGELKGGTQVRRSLLKFDLSSIPTNAVVTSAILTVTDNGFDGATNDRVMSAYRVLRVWTSAGVTWNKFDGSSDWGTAGCSNTTSDREAAGIGTVSMPGTEVAQDYNITLTASKVQEWISGALTNNGIILQMATETDDLHRFYSLEYTTAGDRPVLTITYDIPGFFALL